VSPRGQAVIPTAIADRFDRQTHGRRTKAASRFDAVAHAELWRKETACCEFVDFTPVSGPTIFDTFFDFKSLEIWLLDRRVATVRLRSLPSTALAADQTT